jgi:hypothetical protein
LKGLLPFVAWPIIAIEEPCVFKIDLTESFPLLSRAPIVEAVIGVSARAGVPWEELAISEHFKQHLPEYPGVHSRRKIQHEFKFTSNAQPSRVGTPCPHGLEI